MNIFKCFQPAKQGFFCGARGKRRENKRDMSIFSSLCCVPRAPRLLLALTRADTSKKRPLCRLMCAELYPGCQRLFSRTHLSQTLAPRVVELSWPGWSNEGIDRGFALDASHQLARTSREKDRLSWSLLNFTLSKT